MDIATDDELLKKRMERARAQGMSEEDIQRHALIDKTLARQRQQQVQPQQQAQPVQKKNKFSSNTVLGFGMSLLPGGEILRKKAAGEKITGGDVALEGALSLVPFGLGKAGKLVKGGISLSKAGKTAKTIQKTTDVAADVNQEKNLLKKLITPSQKGQQGETITQKLGTQMSRQSTIAPGSTIGAASQQKKLTKFAQEEPLLAGSSNRKFRNVETVISKHTDKVDTLLSGVKKTVPAEKVQDKMQAVASTITDKSELNAFNKVLGTVQKNVGAKPKYTALEINQARRVLNKELGSVNRKLEKGTTLTAGDRALQEAHASFTDILDKLAPKEVSGQVKDLNSRISTFIKGQPEFKKRSESSDLLGLRGQLIPKIPVVKPALETITDLAGRTLSAAGKAGSTPLARQAQVRAPFSIANAFGASVQQTPQEQTTQDPQEVFAGSQVQDEQLVNEATKQGITDPQQLYDLLSGQGDFAVDPNAQDPMGSPTPFGASSAELFKQALDLRLAGDAKGSKDILEFAKVAADFEKNNKPASQKPLSAESSKVLANANSGLESLSQLKSIIDSQGGVSKATIVPGRTLFGNAGANALGTASFDTAAKNVTDVITRLRTGAALTESEEKFYKSQIPQAFDSPEVRAQKLKMFEDLFSSISNRTGASGSDTTELFNQGVTQ